MAFDMVPISVEALDNELSYEAITPALFENYESIYVIDAETSAYRCCHESESYRELRVDDSGEDFFAALASHVPRVIHPDDRAYVMRMLRRQDMLSALKKEKYYSFVYRLLVDGQPAYRKIRATLGTVGARPCILLGIRDVDETIRQEQQHSEALASMYQKEKNHMEAVLASAAGYLEVNLTQDVLLEHSPYLSYGGRTSAADFSFLPEASRYSLLHSWLCETQIVENRERYGLVGSIDYLLDCYDRGERRASVSFSVRKKQGGALPCREVFFLYRDNSSGDIMSFCVIYDLTEQQRKEKEVAELEKALQMSRIRNSTSQMQPHFLYNALGSIQEVVLDNPEYASELIGDFTTHLRSCIRAMENDAPISFEQELANIKAYVNIEKMRLGKKLQVVYDLPCTDFKILPLSAQPLVENAVRHGIYERGAAGGTVTVRSGQTPEAWFVEVADDGVGFDTKMLQGAGEQGSTGLKNLIFRLDKVMHASVEIQSVPGSGTTVRITIPKEGSVL